MVFCISVNGNGIDPEPVLSANPAALRVIENFARRLEIRGRMKGDVRIEFSARNLAFVTFFCIVELNSDIVGDSLISGIRN